MKRLILLFLSVSLIGTFYSFKDNDPNDLIINKTISKLNSLDNVQYDAEYNLKNQAFGMDTTMVFKCYMETYIPDSLARMRFYIQSPDNIADVYNGFSFFEKDMISKRIVYNDKPDKGDILSNILVVESLFGLRNILPVLLNYPVTSFVRQNDTITDNKNCYNFKITIRGKHISWTQQTLVDSQDGKDGKYIILIDKRSCLPVYYSDLSDGDSNSSSILYKNVETNERRKDIKWNHKEYDDYILLSTKEYNKIENEKGVLSLFGEYAPEFSLLTSDGEYVKLSEQKGNFVLLKFWLPGCGWSIKAIPETNNIMKRYSDKGLKVFGIEFLGMKKNYLTSYINDHDIKYTVLYNGADVAKNYKVISGPTFILIDKDGKIVYVSRSLNKEKLIEAIEKHL